MKHFRNPNEQASEGKKVENIENLMCNINIAEPEAEYQHILSLSNV